MLSTIVGKTRSAARRRRLIALPLAVVLAVAGLTVQQPPNPAAAQPDLPDAPTLPAVKLSAPRPPAKVTPLPAYPKFDPTKGAALPRAQQATVTLPVPGTPDGRAAAAVWARAGSTPITVARARTGATPQQVGVTVAGQQTARAAGVRGVLFSLAASTGAGTVGVDVEDSSFRHAFGGDYAARLRLVRLPACAMTTPQLARCQTQTPLRTDVKTPLTAQVPIAGPEGDVTVLAATSDADGSAGDYTASSLSPGGTWSAGGNTGAFTYSYPIAIPPPIGGVAPTVALSYDSTSQDARTVGTNNQSSWIGDGWSSTENYIERTYQACSEVDGSGAPAGSGDLCWNGQILTMSLNGKSTPIVYHNGAFRPADDSSTTKIENLTADYNGTTNREYFRVTEDGVQYYFGLHRLPGWNGDAEATESVWTVPVYRAHDAINTCPDGAFAATACTLGWRFNLDYVVDLNANAMAYYYQPETGHYGANADDTAVKYTRGGHLERIDYGMTATTVYTATAPEQVLFNTDERCLKGAPSGNNCDDQQFTVTHPEYWPDTPVDLNCTAGATDCIHSPSFWSRKRLTSIVTQIQSGGATKLVDRYDLTHTFPDGGDHAPTLWLEKIQRTGKSRLGEADVDLTTPAITFNPDQLPNRVRSDLPKMIHNRIKNITSEYGAETTVDYEAAPCPGLPDSDPADPEDTGVQQFASTNSTGCMPVYWTPQGQPRPLIDWFRTYRVKRVTTIDKHNRYQDGSAVKLLTEYAYAGAPGWHYDDNELVEKRYRTWGQFRGYPEVHVSTGDPTVFHNTDGSQTFDQKTLTKTFYFLGMNGDTLPGGRTRTVDPLTSSDGTVAIADHNAYAGMAFETLTYTSAGTGAAVDNATVTVPTIIGPTATRSRTGLPALNAYMVRTGKSLTRQKVSGGWRTTETRTFYNTELGQTTTGMPTQVADRGDPSAAGNTTRCSFPRYLDGAVATLVVDAETITTDQDCPTANAAISGNLLSDVRTSYDGNPFARNGDGQTAPARPAKGNATRVQQASTASGATPGPFIDMAETTYDSYGRATAVKRTPRSNVIIGTSPVSIAQNTYTRYTPTAGALPTRVDTVTQVTSGTNCATATASSKDCHLSSVTMEQARQLPISTTDVGGKTTSLTYDALGRLTAVWLPNKNKAAQAEANMLYSYRISTNSPNIVTTQTLLERPAIDSPPTYATSKVLYDAMLRPLETQAHGENAMTVVTNTQYDSHGRTVITNNAWSVTGEPRDQLLSDGLSQVSVPSSTVTDYDAMGRATQVTEQHNNRLAWHTRNAYTGDTTTVLPPTGGVATTQTKDARGQLTQLQQYTTAPTVTGNKTTGFTVTGGTSQNITYQYDAAGQQTAVTGPAADGATGTKWEDRYDLFGRITSHIDPDTGTSYTRYDDAGNVISTRNGRGDWLDYTNDLIGRRLTATDRSTGFKYATWTYDTLRIGKPTASTRNISGVTGSYTVATTGYTPLGNPAGRKITLPSTEQPLPVEYTTSYSYMPNTELLAAQTEPTVGRLSGETITYGHTRLGAPTSTIGVQAYVADTIYTQFGQPSKIEMGAGNLTAAILHTYDAHTLRLTDRKVSRTQGIGPDIDQTTYTYDHAGNPLSVVDKQSETGNTITDAQCYRYNTLARLAQAWTARDECPDPATAQPPTGTLASGPGSYWQSFVYNKVGNRTQLVEHSTTGGADVTTNYIHGCQVNCDITGPQPDTLTATTGGPQPTTFRYSEAGYLIARTPTDNSPGQTLTWNPEGRLAEVTTTDATPKHTKYLYDADGNQLIRRDPGRTTLFAGNTQIVVDTTTNPPVLLGASRTITHGGTGPAIAVRSTLPGAGNHYLLNDHHGTASLAMETTTQALSRQQFKPYGEPRTTSNPTLWPDPVRGYLGAPNDTTTGYTHLGAREYDPTLGRFISADPLLQTTKPNELGGYTYAGNNPITLSDPSGLAGRDPRYPDETASIQPLPNYKPQQGSSGNNSSASSANSGSSGKRRQGFLYTLLKDGNDTVVGTYKFFNDAHQCVFFNMEACDRFETAAKDQASFAWDINQCSAVFALLGDPLGGCRSATEKIGCSASTGLDQECAGHLTFFVGSIVVTEGLSRLAKMPVRGCPHSFAPSTPVLMADGKTKPISDVEVGDEVLATDPKTGETTAREVIDVHLNNDVELTDLTLIIQDGLETLHTTQHHPFWSVTRGQWVDAGDLEPSERLATRGGQPLAVSTARNFTGQASMHDLTVQAIHTYYVLAGKTPVLVHNCGNSIYEAGGKHGPTARGSVRGTNSAEPSNGQGALDNSIEWTPEGPGQAPRRIGVSNGEIVILDRTRQASCGCTTEGGVNDIWHGHVRSWDQLSPGMQSAVRKGGLVDRKGRPLS